MRSTRSRTHSSRTIVHDGIVYERVDNPASLYAALSDGDVIVARKSGHIRLERPGAGYSFTTYTKDGNVEVEAEHVTEEKPWMATRVDADGNVMLDEFGHPNQWILDDATARKRYDVDGMVNGVARPKGAPQPFVMTNRDVALMEPWGDGGSLVPQFIRAGGYVTMPDGGETAYGIAADEFAETYERV